MDRTAPDPRRPDRIGRYEVLGPLGGGGMGQVFEAIDPEFGRRVAVKIIHLDLADRLDVTGRFLREARALARLRHPAIVGLLDAGCADGVHYLVMDRVDGRTLEEALDDGRRLDASLVATVARAIDAAHRQGVVHRDLKPSNILITTDGRPVVIDLGLARLEGATTLTRTGHRLGTLLYMSPEQLAATAEVGPATDVHALGAILHRLVAGRPPHGGATPAEIEAHILEEPPDLPPDLDRDLATILRRALEKSPRDRFATAADLADAIERCVRGERSTTRTRPGWRWRNSATFRRRAAWTLPLAAATAALAVALAMPPRSVATPPEEEGAEAIETTGPRLDIAAASRRLADLEDAHGRAEARPADLRAAIDRLVADLDAAAGDDRAAVAYLLGRTLALGGALDRAESALSRALAIDAGHAPARFHLGWLLIQRAILAQSSLADDQPAAARRALVARWLERAAEVLSPLDGRSGALDHDLSDRLLRILDLHASGRTEAALGEARRAIDETPESPATATLEIVRASLTDRPADRVGPLESALRTRPHDAFARFLLGTARLLDGERLQALESFDAALLLWPDFRLALLNRAVGRGASGDLDGATADLDRVLARWPDDRVALYNRAKAHIELGRLSAARADLDRTLLLRPDFPEALVNRGLVRLRENDAPGALDDLDRGLALAPELGNGHLLRAQALERVGRPAVEVLAALDRAIEVDPSQVGAHFLRGRVLLGLDRAVEADLAFEEARRRGLAVSPPHLRLADALLEAGRPDRALARIDEAVARAPHDPEALLARARLHQRLDRPAAARDDLEQALRRAPPDWPRRPEAEALDRLLGPR